MKPDPIHKAIARVAKDRHPGILGYAEALILACNKNKRHLIMSKLFQNHKKNLAEDEESI